MNRGQASELITEMLQCAINRGAFSGVEKAAIQEAHQVLMTSDQLDVIAQQDAQGIKDQLDHG